MATEEGGSGGGGFLGRLRGGGGGSTGEKKPKTAERRPARVEPKSFFANERTYIQWIGTSMFLMTIASFMLVFSDGKGTLRVGLVLIIVAFVIIFYAIYTFFRRLKLLKERKGSGYIDHFMPVVVSISVCISVIMLLHHYGLEAAEKRQGPAPTYTATVVYDSPAEGCTKRPTVGVRDITYKPSGVFDDQEGRKVLLVPSIDQVTSLSLEAPETPVQTLVNIPNALLEGITYATGNRIFTVSDGPSGKKPILYELAWAFPEITNTNTTVPIIQLEKLRVVNAWKLTTSHKLNSNIAEGVAFLPERKLGNLPPSLLVAGDDYDGIGTEKSRGVVYIYDLPPPVNGSSSISTPVDEKDLDKLDKKGELNANLINSGLEDSKIGELHVFENVLYILHDNARVIRAWDRASGMLLATTILPRVGEGFDQNWAGLAIARPPPDESSNSNSNLRGGSPGSPLLVHLSLDTPPQVWTFNCTQGAVNGSIVFPACASAY